jgi:hypothetical protein
VPDLWGRMEQTQRDLLRHADVGGMCAACRVPQPCDVGLLYEGALRMYAHAYAFKDVN